MYLLCCCFGLKFIIKYFDSMENPNLAKHLCMCIVLSVLLVQMRLLYLKSLKIMKSII